MHRPPRLSRRSCYRFTNFITFISNILQRFFLSYIIRLVNLNDQLKFRGKFLVNNSLLSDRLSYSGVLYPFFLYTAEYLFHNIFTVCSSSLLSFHRFTVASFKLLYLLNVINCITLCHWPSVPRTRQLFSLKSQSYFHRGIRRRVFTIKYNLCRNLTSQFYKSLVICYLL